jgi:hypothetical protein
MRGTHQDISYNYFREALGAPDRVIPGANAAPLRHPQSDRAKGHEKSPQVDVPGGFLNHRVVPAIGFELMTYRLQGGCSTN